MAANHCCSCIGVVTGVILGNIWEVPTIDEKWVDGKEMVNAGTFSQSGLKNIKCYGSSKVFANKMRQVDGVYGVATYVKHHKVKITYNTPKTE